MKGTQQVAPTASEHVHLMMSVMLIALLVTLKIVLGHLNGTLRVADVLFLVLYIRLGLRGSGAKLKLSVDQSDCV